MKFIFIFAGVLLFFIPEGKEIVSTVEGQSDYTTQTATIQGKVTLPPASRSSNRRFRGSAYRDRGNATTADAGNSAQSRYGGTIVSAHPTSFEVTDLTTSDSVFIIQENAKFIPSVTPVTVGSTVHFVNNDSFFHNVFSLTPGAKFNIGRRPTGDIYAKEVPPIKWKVVGLGPIDLFCDIHSQMNAVILSLDTPYYTRVGEEGAYEISNLPAGTYELRVYTRNMDLQTQKITVAAEELYEVNFNLMK